jgi:histidine ammonia-lyase
LEKVKSSFRQIVPILQEDRITYPEINAAVNFLKESTLLELVQTEGINLY